MILVIGSSGQVGRAIQKELKARGVPVTGTYLEKPKDDALRVSLTDEKTIADAFEKAKPSTVILSAAMTNVDLCESMSKECFNVNVEGTKRVVKLCEKHGSKLVFFSSDYVFDGKNGPYVEEDSPNPLSVYGSSKFEGEKITLSKEDSIVVRTTWIFSAFDVKNFAARLVRSLSENKQVKVPSDQFGNPTLAENLASAVADLCQASKKGVYNLAGTGVLSKSDFAKMLAKEFNLSEGLVQPIATADLNQSAKRPLKGGLKVDKFQSEFGGLLNAKKSVEKFKEEFVI